MYKAIRYQAKSYLSEVSVGMRVRKRMRVFAPALTPALTLTLFKVGVTGLEPATSTSRTWRANQLCYTPNHYNFKRTPCFCDYPIIPGSLT